MGTGATRRSGAAQAVRALAIAWVVLPGLAAAGAASSDPVAPAGPCAESRRVAIVPDPDPDYAIAGNPAGRFSAADVAGPPSASLPLAPPPSSTTPRFSGVGACEVSQSGCSPTTAPAAPVSEATGVFPYVPPPGAGRP